MFQYTGPPLQQEISDFVAQSIATSLGIETEVEAVDINSWAARANDQSQDVKDWDILSYGTGDSGGTTGLPNDSHLINYDPRVYGYVAFNHRADSPRKEIAEDSVTLIGMLEAQEAETDVEARAEILTDVQRWILDNHWCNWGLPISSVSYYGFSSRLRDFGLNDWLNAYAFRRESMWIDET